MLSFALAMALQMFFPIFEDSGQTFRSLALTNTSATDAEFTVRVNSPSGTETRLVRLPIPSGRQRVVALDELPSTTPARLEGWVEVEATTDNFTGYLVTGNSESLSALEPATDLALTTYLPHIRVRTGLAEVDQADTVIALINPSQANANVTLRLTSYDRSQVNTVAVEIPARSSRLFPASTLVPAGSARFEGRATVRSFTPIAVWEQVMTPVAWSALRGRSEADLSLGTVMTAPFFVFGGNLQSSLTIYNPTQPAIVLDAAAYDSNGAQLGERVQFTVGAGEAFSEAIDSLMRIPVIASVPGPVITGSIRIREVANRPFRVFANIETRSLGTVDRASMLYWLDSATANVWEIPYIAGSNLYYTGYAILAANEGPTPATNVTIEIIDIYGVVVQRIQRSLSPRSLETSLIGPNVPGAYMRIWADQPITALGTVGRRSGENFDAVTPVK